MKPALTLEHREWLEANRLPRDRWLYSENARPVIDELSEMGLMRAAGGEFGAPVDKGETMNVFGREIPVQTLVSLYMLTNLGRTALSEAVQP